MEVDQRRQRKLTPLTNINTATNIRGRLVYWQKDIRNRMKATNDSSGED